MAINAFNRKREDHGGRAEAIVWSHALALRARPHKRGPSESSVDTTADEHTIAESLSRTKQVANQQALLVEFLRVCQTTYLIRVLFRSKMADWTAQIQRVRQNDPTLTELE
jgi:hypothetical protein